MSARTKQEKHLPAQRIFACLMVALIIFVATGFRQSPVAQALARQERIPILMFGVDAADASQHTDTLMVSVFDPLQNRVGLLSIPRDTKIHLPGYLFNRVNEIYGYYMRRKKDPIQSSTDVKSAIETILSSEESPISIPYFVQIDYSGFTRMVDILGGVWVTIKQSMNYDDNAGGYHFHKEPGRYLMKGQEALFYVRFRGPTGDRGRIYRQQEFVRNMAKRLANPLNVLEFPNLVRAITSSIRTNLNFWDVIYLATAGRRVRSPDIGFYILPGQAHGVYWMYKKEAATSLAAHLILGKSMSEDFTQTIVPQAEQITVNVWNASGKASVAYQITKYLRSEGYDVIDYGTYAATQIPTRVIDRKGKIANAQTIANDLGIDNYHSEPVAKAMVDVEVVIGQDYQTSLKILERSQN